MQRVSFSHGERGSDPDRSWYDLEIHLGRTSSVFAVKGPFHMFLGNDKCLLDLTEHEVIVAEVTLQQRIEDLRKIRTGFGVSDEKQFELAVIQIAGRHAGDLLPSDGEGIAYASEDKISFEIPVVRFYSHVAFRLEVLRRGDESVKDVSRIAEGVLGFLVGIVADGGECSERSDITEIESVETAYVIIHIVSGSNDGTGFIHVPYEFEIFGEIIGGPGRDIAQ
jgi:hypothetical protein